MPAPFIDEPPRRTEILADVDVVVCGGGPAGAGAALAAARAGASVVVLESQLCLGGMATAGMINRLGPYHDRRALILRGIPWEVLRLLVDRGLAQEPVICDPADWSNYWLVFDPEGMKKVLDELLLAAGVKILFNAHFAAPVMDGDAVRGVLFESKSGRRAVLGRIVIDATGDGDVAARAGAPFHLGRDGDGLLQPATLFFKCLNMDWPRTLDFVGKNYARLVEETKRLTGNDFLLPGTDSWLHAEETYFNCLHEHGIDGTKVEDVSRAAVALRRKMWGNTEALRRLVPGCERVSLSASGAALGVRESRRIEGEYTLTVEDVLAGRTFPDQVFRYACFVDIHEPRPDGRSEHANRALEPGLSYGIPYRCLLPKGIENLLVAGRCFSATHEALASARMMPACMAMGEAAGAAAALCAKNAVPPRRLDPARLRAALASQGVNV